MKDSVAREIERLEAEYRHYSRCVGMLVGLDGIVSHAANRYQVAKESVYGTRGNMRSVYARRLVWAILSIEGLTCASIGRAWEVAPTTVESGVRRAKRTQSKAIREYFDLHSVAA